MKEQSTPGPDPHDLLIFAFVADLGSFSRAAARLGLPKSTVSRRLSALEQQLGERLLLRTTRRQSLTEFGLQLLEHARQVRAEVDAVAALSERRHAAPSGRLRVSMPSDLAHALLPGALTAFLARYPDISLEVDLSARRVDLLGEGFDLAVRVGAMPDDALLAARRINELSVSLYASPLYLEAAGQPDSPADLARHHCLCLQGGTGDPVPWTLLRGDARWQGPAPGRMVANSPELLLRMARAGAGITAAPDYFAVQDLREGVLQRVLPQWRLPGETVSAVFPGRKLMPAKTRVFIDLLQQVVGMKPSDTGTRTAITAAAG